MKIELIEKDGNVITRTTEYDVGSYVLLTGTKPKELRLKRVTEVVIWICLESTTFKYRLTGGELFDSKDIEKEVSIV